MTISSISQYQELFGSDVLVLPSKNEPKQALILFHGYREAGIWWLPFLEACKKSGAINGFDETLIILPNAPVRRMTWTDELETGWFDIKIAGDVRVDLETVMERCRLAEHLVNQANEKLKIPLAKIVVGGYSQGAGLTLSALATLREKIGGFFALSGFCPIPDYIVENFSSSNLETPILQCHGEDDPVVKYKYGREVYDLYKGLGFKNWELKTFPDTGHAFAEIEYDGVIQFIAQVFNK